MHKFTCPLCPNKCQLTVYEEADFKVTGNGCVKGQAYGRNQVLKPVRFLTSVVRVNSKLRSRCTVRTDRPVPEELLEPILAELKKTVCEPPVRAGQTLIANILDSEINIIATRNIKA
ncbi:MAG: DUF1667 domain-containing protein [Eubacteriales bacterium]|nr:DUF1667 domain-containing protein [Eubacteriales bacterium]